MHERDILKKLQHTHTHHTHFIHQFGGHRQGASSCEIVRWSSFRFCSPLRALGWDVLCSVQRLPQPRAVTNCGKTASAKHLRRQQDRRDGGITRFERSIDADWAMPFCTSSTHQTIAPSRAMVHQANAALPTPKCLTHPAARIPLTEAGEDTISSPRPYDCNNGNNSLQKLSAQI